MCTAATARSCRLPSSHVNARPTQPKWAQLLAPRPAHATPYFPNPPRPTKPSGATSPPSSPPSSSRSPVPGPRRPASSSSASASATTVDPMGWEDTQKHLLGLSHQSLQSLCKQYNLPANKSHFQLASSLAMLLEKEKVNPRHEREKVIGSTQVSPVTSSAALPNIKEASTCGQENNKRDTYSDRDDVDRPLVKHKKVSKNQADATLTSGTRTSLPPVSVSNGKVDCFSSCSGQGIAHNVNSQTADGIATSSTAPELKTGNHVSAAHVNDKITFIASHPGPNRVLSESRSHKKVGADGIEKGSGSSNDISAKKNSPFQLFVMDDEGIDLFCDLSSTPGDWIDSFKGGVSIPPSIHHTETEMFSNSISSLRSKNDQNKNSSSDNIIMGVENKEPESIAARTNSSLGSTDCENSRSRFCPPDTTAVNSRSSASTLPGTLVNTSGSQEGVPVVHSSCLTSDVQNNMSLDMMAGALGNNMLPQESVDVSAWSGRGHAPLPDDSIQPTKEDMLSPGKTKVCVKIACTQNVVVISSSDESSSLPSVDKQKMLDVTSGVMRTRSSETNELLTGSVPIEEVPMEEDNSHGDTLSKIIAKQTVAGLPATDAQSDASSADRGVAGNFNLADPTPSSVASDNAITPLASKHGAEAANSQASEGLPSVRTRKILFSLRTAAARRTRSSTAPRRTRSSAGPRRSPRLVPQ